MHATECRHHSECLQLSPKLFGSLVRCLSCTERCVEFCNSLVAVLVPLQVLSFIIFPLAMFTRVPLIAYRDLLQLRWQLRLAALLHLMNAIRICSLAVVFGGPRPMLGDILLNGEMIPCRSHSSYYMWTHLVVILVALAGLWQLLAFNIASHRNGDRSDALLTMIVHFGWPPMLCVQLALYCLVPLRYLIWPPSMPSREDLLIRDPRTGRATLTRGAMAVNLNLQAPREMAMRVVIWNWSLFCLLWSFYL